MIFVAPQRHSSQLKLSRVEGAELMGNSNTPPACANLPIPSLADPRPTNIRWEYSRSVSRRLTEG